MLSKRASGSGAGGSRAGRTRCGGAPAAYRERKALHEHARARMWRAYRRGRGRTSSLPPSSPSLAPRVRQEKGGRPFRPSPLHPPYSSPIRRPESDRRVFLSTSSSSPHPSLSPASARSRRTDACASAGRELRCAPAGIHPARRRRAARRVRHAAVLHCGRAPTNKAALPNPRRMGGRARAAGAARRRPASGGGVRGGGGA